MVNHSGVPSAARFFFCTFSMYQPQDGAEGGLSISEQIALEPFANIIESKPTHGMFVLHTTISEVYDRLWVAHEADVGIDAKLQMRGLFDMYRWTVQKFESAATVKTCDGKCGVEKDRAYIERLIMQRGGFGRLDDVIATFRTKMLAELTDFFKLTGDPDTTLLAGFTNPNVVVDNRTFDWKEERMEMQSPVYYYCHEVVWNFQAEWRKELAKVGALLGMVGDMESGPLGASSFPLGPARVIEECH